MVKAARQIGGEVMQFIIKFLIISIWAIPSFFMFRGIGQIFQYIKDQSWTDHYSMNLSDVTITDRFRYIDLAVDLAIGFILYGEIYLRSKFGTPFINDIVFHTSLIVFTLEKVLRYQLCGHLI